MRLINCTQHPITLCGVVIPPSGMVPRVTEREEEFGTIEVEGVPIPLVTKTYGEPVGLPDPELGVRLIVSSMVKAACPDRADLVAPARLVRDEQGRVIGALALDATYGPR
jgi:hypothetical protein